MRFPYPTTLRIVCATSGVDPCQCQCELHRLPYTIGYCRECGVPVRRARGSTGRTMCADCLRELGGEA